MKFLFKIPIIGSLYKSYCIKMINLYASQMSFYESKMNAEVALYGEEIKKSSHWHVIEFSHRISNLSLQYYKTILEGK